MKKKFIRNIGLLLLVLLIGLTGIQLQQRLGYHPEEYKGNEGLEQYAVHEYKIEAEFREQDNIVKVKQQVQYNNVHNRAFETIYFHLYPNAFKTQEKVPFAKEEMDIAYPKGFQPGYIEMQNVKVGGQEVQYDIGGQQNTNMSIQLSEGLQPNEEITISLEYDVKIPPTASRFGHGENTYNFGNWYAIAAVYDKDGWNLHPYYEIGDPFYSDVSNYEVTLRLPKEYVVASTGNVLKIEKSTQGDIKEKVWTVEAKGVRDFAWVASKDFEVLRDKIEGTTIQVYYFKDQQGKKALETARDSISIFSEKFGDYPYEQFSVVSCDFFVGGMEYPNLVYIDENIFGLDSTLILEYIIAHEAAHQWWYGIVGNNQIEEPWVDEALTEYSTILYFREKYGEDIMMKVLKTMVVDDYVRTKTHILGREEIIERSVDEFKDSREYSGLVYSKGAMMFYELEREIGRENFKNILRYYVKENQFSNVTGQDIKDITETVMGKDYQKFFDKWLGN